MCARSHRIEMGCVVLSWRKNPLLSRPSSGKTFVLAIVRVCTDYRSAAPSIACCTPFFRPSLRRPSYVAAVGPMVYLDKLAGGRACAWFLPAADLTTRKSKPDCKFRVERWDGNHISPQRVRGGWEAVEPERNLAMFHLSQASSTFCK